MEVIVTNTVEKEFFVKLLKDEQRRSLLPQTNHVFRSDEKEKTYIEITSSIEESDDDFYEINGSCSIEIGSDGIFQTKNDEKTMLNKIKKEECMSIQTIQLSSNELETIHKVKNFFYKYDEFKKDDYVFINKDRSNLYVFKELKFLNEKKIEALLLKKDSLEEKIINCLTTKINNNTRLKLVIIHSENILFEKFIIINLNDKIEEIYKAIQEKLNSLSIGRSFRLVFKNLDITPKPLDKKFFREIKMDNTNYNNQNKAEASNDKSKQNSVSIDDSNSLSVQEEHEESDYCETESEAEENASMEDVEESLEETIEEEETLKEEEEEISSESINKSKSVAKKQGSNNETDGKLAEKTLIDLDFNFEKDYLCIIPPENNFKIFSWPEDKKDSFSSDSYKNSEIYNILIFSRDLIIKNVCISWYNNGNPCNESYPDFDFMIYEMDTDPIEKAKNLETYYNQEEDFKYDDLESVWTKKKAGSYRLLFEKKKIRHDNCGEDLEFKKTVSNGFYIPTNEIKIFANKIYCFLFKFGQNDNYHDYSYLYNNNQTIKTEEEDLCMYGCAKDNYYFIFGFNYKFNLNNSE